MDPPLSSPFQAPNDEKSENFNDSLVSSSNSRLIVLICGIPASGKTSFAKMLARNHDALKEALESGEGQISMLLNSRASIDIHLVSFDAHLLKEISSHGGAFTAEIWHRSRQNALEEIETLLNRENLSSSPTSGHNSRVILVDDNMNYLSMRKPIFDIAFQRGCPFIQVHIDSSVEVCVERNSKRSTEERVKEETIRRMAFDPICASTRWWDRNGVVISGESDDFRLNESKEHQGSAKEAWTKVLSSFSLPPSPPSPSLTPIPEHVTAESLLQRLEVELRRVVSNELKKRREKEKGEEQISVPSPCSSALASAAASSFKKAFIVQLRSKLGREESKDALSMLGEEEEMEQLVNSKVQLFSDLLHALLSQIE